LVAVFVLADQHDDRAFFDRRSERWTYAGQWLLQNRRLNRPLDEERNGRGLAVVG